MLLRNTASLESLPVLDSEETRRAPEPAVAQQQLRSQKVLGLPVNKRWLAQDGGNEFIDANIAFRID